MYCNGHDEFMDTINENWYGIQDTRLAFRSIAEG